MNLYSQHFDSFTRIMPVILAATLGGVQVNGETPRSTNKEEVSQFDPMLAPYSNDKTDLWNRLHTRLFVRTDHKQQMHVHMLDPFLYRGGTFLLKGPEHRSALELLDQFLDTPGAQPDRPSLQRLFFQRDLWAAFDYVAWYPNGSVHRSKFEPAAIALRTRLAKAIGKLSLALTEINALADNYALAVASNQFRADFDPEQSQQAFLPPDLFDPSGSWVRLHDRNGDPMASNHFEGAGGRAMHTIYLRLPEGRKATEQYVARLGRDSVEQFPAGTMVVMVRRALAVDQNIKLHVTPITELVQIRVYRRIPKEQDAYLKGDFGEQVMYEFILDRNALFAGKHGLRAVLPDEKATSFRRREGDPFELGNLRDGDQNLKQLASCINCHPSPGIHSILSMQRGLKQSGHNNFLTYAWRVEKSYTTQTKVHRFDWGLLQGILEAR